MHMYNRTNKIGKINIEINLLNAPTNIRSSKLIIHSSVNKFGETFDHIQL